VAGRLTASLLPFIISLLLQFRLRRLQAKALYVQIKFVSLLSTQDNSTMVVVGSKEEYKKPVQGSLNVPQSPHLSLSLQVVDFTQRV